MQQSFDVSNCTSTFGLLKAVADAGMIWHRSEVHLPTRAINSKSKRSGYELGECAGLFVRAHSGVHATLPLGKLLLNTIDRQLKSALSRVPAVEIDLPCLQPLDWWLSDGGSGRFDHFEQGLVKLNTVNRDYILSPSSEEMMVELMRSFGSFSYRELPCCYHGTAKRFRAESGGRGIHRGLEFMLHELYGFTRCERDSRFAMIKVAEAYAQTFNALGLQTVYSHPYVSDANGHVALNFYVIDLSSKESKSDAARIEIERGTDEGVLYCENCREVAEVAIRQDQRAHLEQNCCPECDGKLEYKRALRVGQVASLGQIYTGSGELDFVAPDGQAKPVSSFAGGVSPQRVLLALLEQFASSSGVVYPPSVAPFEVELVNLGRGCEMQIRQTQALAEILSRLGATVLIDDRDVNARIKFSESDLIGAPFRALLGEKFDNFGTIEMQDRLNGSSVLLEFSTVGDWLIAQREASGPEKFSLFSSAALKRATDRLILR